MVGGGCRARLRQGVVGGGEMGKDGVMWTYEQPGTTADEQRWLPLPSVGIRVVTVVLGGWRGWVGVGVEGVGPRGEIGRTPGTCPVPRAERQDREDAGDLRSAEGREARLGGRRGPAQC